MSKINNKVIVWGVDNRNTLGILRELGSAEIDTFFLVKGKGGTAVRSKYCKHYAEAETLEDGLKYLIDNFKDLKYKSIIITPGDGVAIFMDRHREELERYFILPITKNKGVQEMYTDKYNMVELAKKVGITCPDTIKFTKSTPVDGIKYPCLIKPAHEKENHYNEFKFKVCKNEKQLKKAQKMVRKDSEFVLQEYVNSEYEIVVYGTRNYDKKTNIAGCIELSRRTVYGFSSYGKTVAKNPYIEYSKICDFLDAIDYYGPFGMEFGIANGKANFFEVNLRNDATSYPFFQSGAKSLISYVYNCAGVNCDNIPVTVEKEIYFIDDIYDYENVLTGKLSKKMWKDQILNSATIYYSEDDSEPWIYESKIKWKTIIKDIVVKRFRIYIVFIFDKIGIRK